jgi:hypothetical protein
MMAFVALQRILIIHGVHFAALIGCDDELGSAIGALLGAFHVAHHLGHGGTFFVDHVAGDFLIGCAADADKRYRTECDCEKGHSNLLHEQIPPFVTVGFL